MHIRLSFSIPLFAILAMPSALGGTQASGEKENNHPPATANTERKSKIDALTIKQRAADKEPAGRAKGDSKSAVDLKRSPIGVNEPGVNKAAKPTLPSEEGVEPVSAKEGHRSASPSVQQAGPEGKPSKGEPQPAKKQ